MKNFYNGAADILEVMPDVETAEEIKPTYVVGALAAMTVVVEAAFPGADMHQLLDIASDIASNELVTDEGAQEKD